MQYSNPVERKQWNAFKLAFRKAHPDLKRDTQYYKRLRSHYNERDCKTLDEWLAPIEAFIGAPSQPPAPELLR